MLISVNKNEFVQTEPPDNLLQISGWTLLKVQIPIINLDLNITRLIFFFKSKLQGATVAPDLQAEDSWTRH